jgi:hypothetical protein
VNKFREFLSSISNVISDHFPGFVLLHIWVTALMIFSGADFLEPEAASWFWAPVIAAFLANDRYAFYEIGLGERLGSWYFRNHGVIYFVNWIISVLVVPLIFWSFFYNLDMKYLHPIREATGKGFGLGGQTGLVLLVNGILSLPLIYWEIGRLTESRPRRRRSR